MKKYLSLLSLLSLLSSRSFSVTTSFWKIKGFEQCKLSNIMLDKDGFASLAPEVNPVWENTEVYIWAMLESGNALYVATGAEGKVYKIEDFKASLILDAKEAGVFSLATSKGKIYAGTSPNGRIFVIDKDGTSQVFKDTHQKYIWKIVFDEKGDLYAATGTTGLILKIKQEKIDTFYTTQQMNVSFLTYFDSHFYAGTSEEGLLFKIDKQGKGFCLYDADEPEITGLVKIDTLLFVSATSDTQSSIYRIYPDNRISKIWNTPSPIRGFQSTSGGKLLVAAGTRGYRISQDGKAELIAELPTNISCIMNNWIATSEVGKVYKLADKLADKGNIESPAYDTKSTSRWGKPEFKPTEGIEFTTRTGNTKDPDPTWDIWKPLDTDYKINSQHARFIQWKATLTSKTSTLKEVKIPFLPQNEAPEIYEIKILTANEVGTNLIRAENPGTRKITWKAHDPNGDNLIFNLYFKLTDEEHWTLLKESIKDTLYSIDPKSFPDGEYLIKVEAVDSPSNPPKDAMTSNLISEPYLIDNTPPEIKIIGIKDRFLFFEAQDNFNIKSCMYALDGGKWQIAFPVDKLFDSQIERFKVEVGIARKVVVKVQDTYGNTTLKSKLIE